MIKVKILLIIFTMATISSTSQDKTPLIFGHRGCRGLYPENSIEGFQKAIDLGVDGIEWDVVVNKDLQLVISHEPYLDKKYCLNPDSSEIKNDKSLNIFKMSQDSIQQYDCGTKIYSKFPEQIKIKTYKPLFQDVISKINFKDITILFEIKSEKKDYGKYQPEPSEFITIILKEIESFEYKENIIFMSFDPNIINELNNRTSKYKLVYLTYSPFTSVKKSLKDLNFKPYAIGMYYPTIGSKDILQAKQLGLKTFAWTVNKEKEGQKLSELGIDGLITDYPNLFIK